MVTQFPVGSKVQARIVAQGLHAGRIYTVTEIEQRRTFAGTFVRYELDRSLRITNGHLLLEEAPVDTPTCPLCGNTGRIGTDIPCWGPACTAAAALAAK